MPTPDSELEAFLQKALPLVWCDAERRRRINRAGIHLLPANFYSTAPTIDEIEASFEYRDGPPPYLTEQVFDAARMRDYLAEIGRYSHEFDPPREGDPDHAKRYFWSSETFSHSDAMAYYCVLRHRRPARVVEVGAGHSTLVALAAMDRNGSGKLTCVEPYPRPFLRDLARAGRIELIEKPAQDLPATWFRDSLDAGDVLFIDSTHTVKAGSDCLHLYLRVIPALRGDVLIHAHDIFLPDGYPLRWLKDLHIYWTEQYLLLALLLGGTTYRVLFGSAYHKRINPAELEAFMHGRATAGGGSFWFEKSASPSA